MRDSFRACGEAPADSSDRTEGGREGGKGGRQEECCRYQIHDFNKLLSLRLFIQTRLQLAQAPHSCEWQMHPIAPSDFSHLTCPYARPNVHLRSVNHRFDRMEAESAFPPFSPACPKKKHKLNTRTSPPPPPPPASQQLIIHARIIALCL